jgi:Type I phosphodiesterase / nucleotide pyrophosphatase
MLNLASLKKVNGARFSQRFVRPCYDSYCFSNLPATIQLLLTGEGQTALPTDVFGDLPTRYDTVIFFFIDAFGWRFFERYAEKYDILKTFLQHGMVSKLTSQFPSTTAAHVTCIHTGLDVGQSGIYEWNYYEPLIDDIISPLMFSYAGDKLQRDTIRQAGIPPTAFFPNQTFYQTLSNYGVRSHILQYETYSSSTYSEIVFKGAHVHPYQNLQDAFQTLTELIKSPHQQPDYYFFYFDRIDTICHNYGPSSRQVEEAIDYLLLNIERLITRDIPQQNGKTLFMMTADHGQVEVHPYNTCYLNREMPTLHRSLKSNHRKHVLAPAGSARDMFLHVKEECIDQTIHDLRTLLKGKAEIYRTEELLAQHFFGLQPPTRTFLQRVGNVVILPYKRETVWWYEEGKFSMHFLGHHGGVTPEEMEIPLFLLPL